MISKRIYGLDILRAIAILLVVFQHSTHYFGFNVYTHSFISLGDGVTMFFVLSGYLIGRILLTNKGSLISFWLRRWLRTLPAYFFVLILLMLWDSNLDLRYFTFTQAFFNARYTDLFPESWSLCVEEWFYLLIPLLFLFRKRNTLSWIFLTIVLITAIRIYKTSSGMDIISWGEVIRKSVITRLDSIMYGMLAAYISLNFSHLWDKLKKLFALGLLLWIGNFLISDIYGYGWYGIWLSIPIQTIAVFFMIPYLSTIKTGKGIAYRFFTFISMISYSMYLINSTPVNKFLQIDRLEVYTKNYSWFPFLIFVISTFAGAYFLYRFIEKPFMNLRNHKPFRKSNLQTIPSSKDLQSGRK